jgi:hypothetical protein
MIGAVVAVADAGFLSAGKLRLTISLSNLNAGIYLLKVNVNGATTGVKKLVKE